MSSTYDNPGDYGQCENTGREIWRGPDDGAGSAYADSLHITKEGDLGINSGGSVYVKSIHEWHRLAGGPMGISSIGEIARRDRLLDNQAQRIKALDGLIQKIEAEARRYAEMYPQSSDGRNTFIIFADWVAGLSVTSQERP